MSEIGGTRCWCSVSIAKPLGSSTARPAHIPSSRSRTSSIPRLRARSPPPTPPSEDATAQGRAFKSVNERKKVHITDAKLFPKPVARLNAALASPAFLSDLSYVTGIPRLLADEQFVGGGMHVIGPGGRLDVHVDFNYIASRSCTAGSTSSFF